MFSRFGQVVDRHWPWVLLGWILLAVALRLSAPRWDDITYDGDLAYLPANRPSVVGERLLAEAFPLHRAKSQVVLIVAREGAALEEGDIQGVGFDLARRMKLLHGLAALSQAERLASAAGFDTEDWADRVGVDASPTPKVNPGSERTIGTGHLAIRVQTYLDDAQEAFDDALYFDEGWAGYWSQAFASTGDEPPLSGVASQRIAPSIYDARSRLHAFRGDQEAAELDRDRARSFDGVLDSDSQRDPRLKPTIATADAASDRRAEVTNPIELAPILDVWTWADPIFGDTLVSRDESAALILIQLQTEFLATENIPLLNVLREQLSQVRRNAEARGLTGLSVGMTGSAAVGADMLSSAAESIRHTELFTVLLVVMILALVYRSPLLVFVPLVSIGVALVTSTSLIALLTQLDQVPGFGWWELKVFTTTKIFIVVILFGAGTDYCLFLISRYKEELLLSGSPSQAIRRALCGVGDALAASALTTIIGLAMMFFAEFGKFRYSGPIIGLSLLVTLLTCVTLTPALLRAMGTAVYWPFWKQPTRPPSEAGLTSPDTLTAEESRRWGVRIWQFLADRVVKYPGRILVACLLLMAPMTWSGVQSAHHVTYDLLNSLGHQRPSRRGAEILKEHFPVGEGGPITILAHNVRGEFETRDGRKRIKELTESLYDVPGVQSVRSLTDPLGEFLPGETRSFFDRRSWNAWVRQPHRRTAQIFLAQASEYEGDVARFDLILDHDPFSLEATRTLQQVERRLRKFADNRTSWLGTEFSFAGTTAGIRDLREVTQSDNVRIEVLVVVAVLLVLLAILRRPIVCLYMIGSVLLSYYFTMGVTHWFFEWAYQDSFAGLDWKVPLFLFVILVAIGQDYNVYLATRVFEEQAVRGPREGLRVAIVRTGGIITSCGLIMAGTFLSMTSGAWTSWLPAEGWLAGLRSTGALRGIVELGFALALGVTLDTFIVRPILLPAFLAVRNNAVSSGRGGEAPDRKAAD